MIKVTFIAEDELTIAKFKKEFAKQFQFTEIEQQYNEDETKITVHSPQPRKKTLMNIKKTINEFQHKRNAIEDETMNLYRELAQKLSKYFKIDPKNIEIWGYSVHISIDPEEIHVVDLLEEIREFGVQEYELVVRYTNEKYPFTLSFDLDQVVML